MLNDPKFTRLKLCRSDSLKSNEVNSSRHMVESQFSKMN